MARQVGGTFVPRISSAPFSWGVIASFDRVYTSSSSPQYERNSPQGGNSYDQYSRDCFSHLYDQDFSRSLIRGSPVTVSGHLAKLRLHHPRITRDLFERVRAACILLLASIFERADN
jgi:hypothetical protein